MTAVQPCSLPIVTSNVYTAPEPEKFDTDAFVVDTSVSVNPVTDSLNVAVIVYVAWFVDPVVPPVNATDGAALSTVPEWALDADAVLTVPSGARTTTPLTSTLTSTS